MEADAAHDPSAVPPAADDGEDGTLAERLAAVQEAARREGFDRGYADGYAQAQREVQEIMERLRGLSERATFDLVTALKAVEGEIVELALAVAERVVERELRTDPNIVRTVVRAALAEVAALPVAQIRVNPDDLVLIETARSIVVPPGFDPQIPIVVDPHVERGGCLIDTTSGLVDAQPRTKLAEIRQRVLALLSGELV